MQLRISIMTINCLECGKDVTNRLPHYFVVPGHIIVPNEYYLCNDHKDNQFSFEDIYNNDGTRKKK
jgi:hypothetical protein